jgi:hypothetical protein
MRALRGMKPFHHVPLSYESYYLVGVPEFLLRNKAKEYIWF